MKQKDYYDFVLKPTKNEIINEKLVETLYGIVKLNIPKYFTDKKHLEMKALNNGLINWNTDILTAKYFSATMFKYLKYYEKSNLEFEKDAYNFWFKVNSEKLIVILTSLFDKSLKIMSILLELKIDDGRDYEGRFFTQLENKLQSDSYLNECYKLLREISNNEIRTIRNSIIHNYSDLFAKNYIKIKDGTISYVYKDEMENKDILECIKNYVAKLNELKKIIEVFVNGFII